MVEKLRNSAVNEKNYLLKTALLVMTGIVKIRQSLSIRNKLLSFVEYLKIMFIVTAHLLPYSVFLMMKVLVYAVDLYQISSKTSVILVSFI